MMYSNSKKTGHWNVEVKHWNDPGQCYVGQNKHDFADRKKKEDADSLFRSGMAALMQGKLRKAKNEFNLCLSHNLAHRQAPEHLEVVEFCSKSQRVANAAIKFLGKKGMLFKLDGESAKAVKAGMAHAGFDTKSAAVAFGIGQAYLAMGKTLDMNVWARNEFERALSLLGSSRAEKYMKAAVHRIYAQAENEEFHRAQMRRLDPHIPADW
ncbi:MAG: hypothetical protein WC861_00260 [Candidatus Micrarchaeia archaeon]|jgi:hypothetical protein